MSVDVWISYLLAPFKRPSHADPTAEVAATMLSLAWTAQRCHLALCPFFGGHTVSSKAIVTEPTRAKAAIYTRTAEHLLRTDGQHLHRCHRTTGKQNCDNQNARKHITIAKTPEC